MTATGSDWCVIGPVCCIVTVRRLVEACRQTLVAGETLRTQQLGGLLCRCADELLTPAATITNK